MSMGAEMQQSPAAGRAEEGLEPSTLCSICQQHPYKYKCPGCQAQTCSLACSKQHKQQTGCSGQRDKFAFVPMQQFSDKHLLSDYRWLEEVSRADSNARRLRPPTPQRELPQHLSQLVHQAKYRGVRLLIMPPGMQKRQQNSTRYEFRARKMHWRVEWRFPAAAAAAAAAQNPDTADNPADLHPVHSNPKPYVITDGRVDEETLINKILSVHLEYQPGRRQALALRRYREAGIDKLVILTRKERCPANAIRYYRIDPTQSLRSQLAGKLIVEYPSLIVLLPGEESSYNIVSLEEQQAEQQAGFGGRYGTGLRQQQQQMLPPPPPPRSAGPQQQQQQQQGEAEEPAAKRQCSQRSDGRSDTAVEATAAAGAGAAVAGAGAEVSAPVVGEQQQQQQQPNVNTQENNGQQQQPPRDRDTDLAPQQQPQQLLQLEEDGTPPQQQQQPKYYYYDPTDGADEDAADFLAGLEEEQDEQQQQQQPAGQMIAANTTDGQATMMALLGHYDEHEIEID